MKEEQKKRGAVAITFVILLKITCQKFRSKFVKTAWIFPSNLVFSLWANPARTTLDQGTEIDHGLFYEWKNHAGLGMLPDFCVSKTDVEKAPGMYFAKTLPATPPPRPTQLLRISLERADLTPIRYCWVHMRIPRYLVNTCAQKRSSMPLKHQIPQLVACNPRKCQTLHNTKYLKIQNYRSTKYHKM